MAFEGAFTLSQSINTPSTFTLTDTSTGSDPTITGRRIWLYKYNGDTIVPSGNPAGQLWIDWDILTSTITLDVLDRDYSFNITVTWDATAPDPAGIYTVTNLFNFTDFTETDYYGFVQEMGNNKWLISVPQFFMNMIKLRVFIDNSNSAVSLGQDIQNGQLNLDLAYELISNPQVNFS